MNKYRYSILTFIIGKNYELVREIQQKQDDVEYILVTDVADLTSNTWKVIYDEDLLKFKPGFERCFNIRYNVFKYCSCDICVTIDGSMQMIGSLDNLIEEFNFNNYDICLMPHPLWANMRVEYSAWVKMRGYPIEQANRMLTLLNMFGYDINKDTGLFQLCFSIKRNNIQTLKLDVIMLSLLKTISGNNAYERLDQTWFTFIMNTQFNWMKVLPVSEQIVRSYAIQWFWHNTTNPNTNIFYDINAPDMKRMFGNDVECKKMI